MDSCGSGGVAAGGAYGYHTICGEGWIVQVSGDWERVCIGDYWSRWGGGYNSLADHLGI